ncbi:MAG: Electron transport complex protein RnfE [Candidatus Methanolliviera sp. GoM_asphalt]|nr:MAG: Electron transport complex protein RnfE [Candidatus Methanolliviera sp. GoM_asphalt]
MIKDFTNGIVKVNPIFVLALGLCPTLAISTSIDNAIGMGAAVIFVLLFSNLMISLIRNVISKEVRIPCFIVIIATFVTIVSLSLQAYLPSLYESLGIYVPLIVVNCIILGRAEAFASKNPVSRSVLDALGIGLGFTLSLIIISIIRELLGTGGISVFGYGFTLPFSPATFFIMPAGAFLVMGVLLGLLKRVGVIR